MPNTIFHTGLPSVFRTRSLQETDGPNQTDLIRFTMVLTFMLSVGGAVDEQIESQLCL